MPVRLLALLLVAALVGLLAYAPDASASAAAPTVGEVLTTTNGAWQNGPTSFSYQWEDCDAAGANCVFVSFATAQSYTIVVGDVGHTIRVIVTARNAGGAGSTTAAQTGVVTNPVNNTPVNSALPVASGTTTSGQTLSTTNGSWTNSPTSFSYQWQDCDASVLCSNISGATANTYALTDVQVNHTIRAQVTATNASGSGAATTVLTSGVAKASGGGTFSGSVVGNAGVACSRYASPTVNDSTGTGAIGAPWATIGKLVGALTVGQIGCLRAGSYNSGSNTTLSNGAGVTLTAFPAEAATIHGGLLLSGAGLTLSYLNVDLDLATDPFPALCAGAAAGTVGFSGRTPTQDGGAGLGGGATVTQFLRMDGSNQTVTHSNVFVDVSVPLTNRGAAIGLGFGASPSVSGDVISFNRIHDGGFCPVEQHGLYINKATGYTLQGNWIYNYPAGTGIQMWDGASNGSIISNVIDNASSCMDLGGNTAITNNNVVQKNVCYDMAGLQAPYADYCGGSQPTPCTGPDPGNPLFDFWGGGLGTGNSFTNNLSFCKVGLTHCTSTISGTSGVTVSGNSTGDPLFVSAATHDYRLNGGSPAATFGTWNGDITGTATTTLLGNSDLGANATTGMDADSKRAMVYTAGRSGTINRLTVYLLPGTTSGTQLLKGVIYADNAGTPGALLATSAERIYSSAQGSGWFDLPFSPGLAVTSGTTYWLGIITGATANVAAFRWDTGTRDTNVNVYGSGPSNPFGTPVSDSLQMSLYGTIQ